MNRPTFSIVLPIYKQLNHISELYDAYTKQLTKLNDTWELIFIFNGPDDGGYEKLGLLNNNINVKSYKIGSAGWGKAVKSGLSLATGKYLCYTNSARTEINDLILILNYAKANDNNIVKATRIIRESIFRKIGSTLYNLENRLLFKTPVWDVNGTPKVIPSKIYNTLNIISDNDLIDAEIIAKCVKNHIRIIEVPILLTKRLSGKSTTNLKSALKMYLGLIRLKNRLK